jgi:hypothetical protein
LRPYLIGGGGALIVSLPVLLCGGVAAYFFSLLPFYLKLKINTYLFLNRKKAAAAPAINKGVDSLKPARLGLPSSLASASSTVLILSRVASAAVRVASAVCLSILTPKVLSKTGKAAIIGAAAVNTAPAVTGSPNPLICVLLPLLTAMAKFSHLNPNRAANFLTASGLR